MNARNSAPGDPIREVEKAQRAAADPQSSVWVSANAGSGKTRVLVDRVARLLLAGARPQKILCLTYTRAAAAEMQDRLFKTLGGWALMEEAALREALVRLGEGGRDLAEARRLFARALETPGGLRLQTIHGFCESVLRRFPVEAELSPRFAVMPEEEGETLRREAAHQALLDLRDSPAEADQAAAKRFFAEARVMDAGPFGRQGSLEGLASAAFLHRERFLAEEQAQAAPGAWAREALGLAEGETEEGLWSEFARGLDLPLLAEAADHLTTAKGAGKTDLARGKGLKAALTLSGLALREALSAVLLKKDGEPYQSLMTKSLREARPDLAQALAECAEALYELNKRLSAFPAAARAADFARFARRLIEGYDSARLPRGLLDFDDLIAKAAALFDGDAARAWALFKLDEGVDHILVDEAQDTSPAQWRVAASLAEEFYVGRGAREETKRTLFVVGDEKQSIYSFQGADHAAFAAQRARFERKAVEARDPLRDVPLTRSFRSSPVILEAVDHVFADPKGLTSAPGISHSSARPELPGRVEWWPAFRKEEEPEPPEWTSLAPASAASDPQTRLAEFLAGRLAAWIGEEPLAPGGRKLRAGDVLVLVRNRGAFSRRLISALKEHGQPVAGEDRIGLRASLAAQDLLATARAALLPSDSLSLATALRSPLFGFSEADLLELTARPPGERGRGTLWGALTRRREERAHWALAHRRMGDLIARVDFLRPYEFFEKILCDQDGRRRLLRRLGSPAAEPVDELLTQALDYEAGRPPTLQGFLRWIEGLGAEIKRDMEQSADEIRVMTVHGAKGLEAEMVVVADPGEAPDDRRESRLIAAGEGVLWLGPKEEGLPAKAEEVRQARLARIQAEHRRLLYVAMTRARKRLILCGWRKGEPKTDPDKASPADLAGAGAEGSWHHAVWTGLKSMPGVRSFPLPDLGAAFPEALCVERGGAAEAEAPAAAQASGSPPKPWPVGRIAGILPPEPAPPAPLAPSRLSLDAEPADFAEPGSAESEPEPRLFPAGPGLTREEARARGVALHRILERLAEGEAPDSAEPPDLLALAERLTSHPDLAEVFRPGPEARILSEAPVFGAMAALDGRSVSGSIDRMIVAPDRVLVVDFKTGAPPKPEKISLGHRRQLAVYRAAAMEIFPGRLVEAALLWLDKPRLDRLDPQDLDQRLAELKARLERAPPEAEADLEAEEEEGTGEARAETPPEPVET
nr:double-strand break repair helicase AddA [Neomegalonema perideroedes]